MTIKINQILAKWTTGELHSLRWLSEEGIGSAYAQSWIYRYYEQGLFEKIGPGIYKKTPDEVGWVAAVRLLQGELKRPVHVAGRTALELEGFAHHVPMGDRPVIFLRSYTKREVLPKWVSENDFGCHFRFGNASLFSEAFFAEHRNFLMVEYVENRLSVKISCRELAILEFMHQTNLTCDFESAQNYLEGLWGTRVDILQVLLENCSSIKLKRVFLYLSEKLGMSYFEKLDLSKIDLGKGKRQVVKENAQFDKKYQITVPKSMDGDCPF